MAASLSPLLIAHLRELVAAATPPCIPYLGAYLTDMVMIGDQLVTDVCGANNFGLDSALVGTGVADAGCAELPQDLQPTYLLHSLRLQQIK